jgi:hypothetical protein
MSTSGHSAPIVQSDGPNGFGGSRLELRSWPWIVTAYFVVPMLVAIETTIRVATTRSVEPPHPWLMALFVAFIAAAVLLAELIFVTPILVGFSRYRWRWLNGWSGCAIGALTAMSLAALTTSGWPPGNMRATNDKAVYISVEANGALRVQTSWGTFLSYQVQGAVIGAGIALTFRLLAARVADPGKTRRPTLSRLPKLLD